MAVFPSIMELFRSAPAQQPLSPQQVAAQLSTSQQALTGDPTVNSNPTVPNDKTPRPNGTDGTGKVEEAGEKAPLANFKDLWEPNKDQKPTPTLAPDIKLDQTKLAEIAKKADFTKGIDPELMRKAGSGDVGALATVINTAAQAGYAASAAATTSMIDTALQRQATQFANEVMPDILRKHNIGTAVRADNALYETPAATPILNMIEAQLTVKYPTASPAEIANHAKTYLKEFGQLVVESSGMTVSPKAVESANTRKEPDWAELFGVSVQ